MKILVIDAQGGGIGKQAVSAIREAFPDAEIIAVGTNTTATSAMLRAGATMQRPARMRLLYARVMRT